MRHFLAILVVVGIAAPASRAGEGAATPAAELTARLSAYAEAWTGDGSVDLLAFAPFYAEEPTLPSFGAFSDASWDPDAIDGFGRLELDPEATATRMSRIGEVATQALGSYVATTSRFRFETDYGAGRTIRVALRHTAVWERGRDGWRMVHEHLSAPLDAALDARPTR